jgi:hypothetical protein
MAFIILPLSFLISIMPPNREKSVAHPGGHGPAGVGWILGGQGRQPRLDHQQH